MTITVEATFENGLLKPKQPLTLAEGAEVRLTIHVADEEPDPLDAVIGIGEGPPDGARTTTTNTSTGSGPDDSHRYLGLSRSGLEIGPAPPPR